jgi:hypothetical protein
MKTEKYFSIHSIAALQSKGFSIVHGNIDNTPEKLELAKKLFESENFYIEFHNYKQDLRVVVR